MINLFTKINRKTVLVCIVLTVALYSCIIIDNNVEESHITDSQITIVDGDKNVLPSIPTVCQEEIACCAVELKSEPNETPISTDRLERPFP